MLYHVDYNSSGFQDGSPDHPFSTIQQAADVASAGDEVVVYPGIYREYVDPKNAGTPEARITYRSSEPLKAVITGAEEIKGWTDKGNGVWEVSVDNGIFGDYNPFDTPVSGDWFDANMTAHTGDVYLNHRSMYEVTDPDKVLRPEPSPESWDRDFSVYVWHCAQKDGKTVITANFHGFDPNREEVEISVRQDCFLPSKEGVGYITLSGFTVREAATQWAPPTAYQDGMIGPHWSKGWIIEDCEIYESKCSGISVGKYLQKDNDNKWLKWKYKDGTQTERECICEASYGSWNRETVGSHIIRRCTIHDCGQTGIVGHLGGIFSLIEDNHIYRINVKKNLAGAEIGGIKMHAAIDTVIRNNHIHHCTRGLWLDWQAQGTRVSGNLFHHNSTDRDLSRIGTKEVFGIMGSLGEDLFIEVSHGPTLVDNNWLLSERSVKMAAQGAAFVNNLFYGSITCVGTGTDNDTVRLPSPRYTPYHVPHGTDIAGFMTILHGDCRFYRNFFVQRELSKNLLSLHRTLGTAGRVLKFITAWDTWNFACGTFPYDDYPTSEEWQKQYEGYCGMGSPQSDRYYDKLPVWTDGNYFFNGARPCKKEVNAREVKYAAISVDVTTETKEAGLLVSRNGWNVYSNLDQYVGRTGGIIADSGSLGMAFEPEMRFESPDGSDLEIRDSLFGGLQPRSF